MKRKKLKIKCYIDYDLLQIMSVFYTKEEDVDQLAEKIMERAEERELVHNYYLYPMISQWPRRSDDKVEGRWLFYK